MISEVFDEPLVLNTRNDHQMREARSINRSFLYIISKRVDQRTFLKIGAGKSTHANTGGRLGDIQTVLLPGLQNIGFKLWYIFIYPYQTAEGDSYSVNIEKALHKYLRGESDYKSSVLQFASNYPSEWYLPEPNDYKGFIDFVLSYISVQIPFPEASYHFYMEPSGSGLQPRRSNDFLQPSERSEILQFRQDFAERKREGQQMIKQYKHDREKRKGNLKYWKRKLIGQSLGKEIDISDVFYYKGPTKSAKIHGKYYVNVKRKTRKKKLPIDFTDDNREEWTSVSNVLEHMKTLGLLEQNDLTDNYNHYANGPIEWAKTMLARYKEEDNIKFKKRDLGWLIGREVIDKNGKRFRVVDLDADNTNARRVLGVRLKNEKGELKTAAPRVVMKLSIDFQKGVKTTDYEITDDYVSEKAIAKYTKGDFVEFQPNYFKDATTGNKDTNTYVAMIFKPPYEHFHAEKNEPALFYDLLFEHEIWRLRADSVDANVRRLHETKVKDRARIGGFLANLTVYRSRIGAILKRFAMPHGRRTRKKGKPA